MPIRICNLEKCNAIFSLSKPDFAPFTIQNHAYSRAKPCILRCEMQHIAMQNNGVRHPKPWVLRCKTMGFAKGNEGNADTKTRNSLTNSVLNKRPIFSIFRTKARFLTRRWPFSGVNKNQCVSKKATSATPCIGQNTLTDGHKKSGTQAFRSANRPGCREALGYCCLG